MPVLACSVVLVLVLVLVLVFRLVLLAVARASSRSSFRFIVVSFFASSCLSIGGALSQGGALSSCRLVVLSSCRFVPRCGAWSFSSCLLAVARGVACGSCRVSCRACSSCVRGRCRSRLVPPFRACLPWGVAWHGGRLVVPPSFACVVVLSSRACLSSCVVRCVSCLR